MTDIDFDNCVVENWFDTRNYPPEVNDFVIKGIVTFIEAELIQISMGNQWFDTIVRREFPCRVLTKNPELATLKIFKPDGELAYSGNPDQNGNLIIDEIIFDATNYVQAYMARKK